MLLKKQILADYKYALFVLLNRAILLINVSYLLYEK